MVRISFPRPKSAAARVNVLGEYVFRHKIVLWAAVAGLITLSQLSSYSRNLTSMTRGRNQQAMELAQQQCRFFLAESAIPRSGLGIFTAVDIAKGEQTQSMPDICIYVTDTPSGTDFHTHSWAGSVFMGRYEGENSRGACEGVATLVNTMPDSVNAAELVPFKVHTNAGLKRDQNPGAGAITHYYGVTSKARRNVAAGSEITIDYGDWHYDSDREYVAPIHTAEWVRKHGMCIDHIEIRQALDPEMGRGAFARRFLPRGSVVAPAPLQTFKNRNDFAQQKPEALFVNYCLQLSGTNILLFPYGPGVNLINHSSEKANVKLQWSTNAQNHRHWLDLPLNKFWEMVYPGALILDVVALRDIQPGEELYLDYGPEWEAAWQDHFSLWEANTEPYVYPADMDLTQPFRTLEEQKKDPYPSNLATICFEGEWDIEENKPVDWTEPTFWTDGMLYCHILKREQDSKTGSYFYEVSLGYRKEPHPLDDTRYITRKVPHKAIMFVDKPYQSDMHLKNSFRHPIGIPDELIPEHWRATAMQ